MTRLRRLLYAFHRWLSPGHCPRCGLPFVDWFFKLPIGRYCWPCYRDTGVVYSPPKRGATDA